ncbi:uncharacterized protein CC84DRAFT_1176106 [Paraphaeosphaeria sporulosa]|uniref:Uncharacterized protein n=1 Tax=Paraphaeosphaeria sporulosa TaxID=1460663 RepID=A0A177CFN0_9PLEO|nr:uncharacterized protein CC84DRAFT_1176106 [Paraphaeosphaeria sporulosa]OAG06031.1 hypothetical protein CC84DRAFT_1176106 [Paraphaeosphaeria sporulosa]
MLTQDNGYHRVCRESGPGTYYRLPPPGVLRFLRRITVVIGPLQSHWDRLHLLTYLKERCKNLQQLTVLLQWDLSLMVGEVDSVSVNDDLHTWLTGFGIHDWKTWSFSFHVQFDFLGHPCYHDEDDWVIDGFDVVPADPAIEEYLDDAIRNKVRCNSAAGCLSIKA